jgi:hypothetical protein
VYALVRKLAASATIMRRTALSVPSARDGGMGMQTAFSATSPYEAADIMGGLYGDGFIARKDAFSRAWAQHCSTKRGASRRGAQS